MAAFGHLGRGMLKSAVVIQSQTDSRRPEESEMRELEVVRLDEKKKTGRPLKLTEAPI